jgi:hypothetical protein
MIWVVDICLIGWYCTTLKALHIHKWSTKIVAFFVTKTKGGTKLDDDVEEINFNNRVAYDDFHV